MKLLLTALCATFMVAPAFACENGECKGKKEQGRSDNEKGDRLADCDKCKKGEDKKDEGAIADCDKCKKGEDKKDEGALAGCDKCKKGDDNKEGTIA